MCKYFMRTRTCKYGTSCKYHHPSPGVGSISPVLLNYNGYPLRPGEEECSYYLRTGECKFGESCKFHHPEPSDRQVEPPIQASAVAPVRSALYPPMQSPSGSSTQQYGVLASNWPVASPHIVPGAYFQGLYGHIMLPPAMVSVPGWSPYLAESPSTQHTIGPTPFYGLTRMSASSPAYTEAYTPISSAIGPTSSSQRENMFPERPGQPECQYYMRTGGCRFGSTCRFHHPPKWNVSKTDCALSPVGLPLRPGAPRCAYYSQHGKCKFGGICKFDHPMGPLSYSPSTSSLADMPVAPYPVGSSIGSTLAPSFSFPDFQPESVSGSKNSSSTRISSISRISSATGGSLLSKGSSSTGQGGEAQPPS